MTHTYATMAVSEATFNEISQKLHEADYGHAITYEDGAQTPIPVLLDMHGIALVPEENGDGN